MSDRKNRNITEDAHRRRSRDRLLAAACAVLMLASAWASGLSAPPVPVQAPPAAAPAQASSWNYPSNAVFYSLEVDDFCLQRDGSFEIRSSSRPGGISQGYLEKCMKLTPAVPFRVEPAEAGSFRVVLEHQGEIPRTLVELPPDPGQQYPPDPFAAWIEPHLAARVVTEDGNGGAPVDRPFRIEFSADMDFTVPPEDAVAFSPDLPCTMEASGGGITVTPEGIMPYAASYSVIISSRLKNTAGESFPADQVLELATESRDFSLIMINQAVTTAQPRDAEITMEYQLDTAGRGPRQGSVTLYSIGGTAAAAFDAYVSFLKSAPLPEVVYPGDVYDRHNLYYQTGPGAVPPDNMTELDAWTGDFPEGLSTVSFENPGPGFYIIGTTVTDTKTQQPLTWYKPVQVASPSIYMQSAKGETLFWLNDSVTGKPLSGYTLRFLRGDFEAELGSAAAGADGAAILPMEKPRWQEDDSRPGAAPGELMYTFTGFRNESASMTPEEAGRRNSLSTVFAVYDREGNPVYADTTASLTDRDLSENRYYSFLYLDRAIYRPTDEIHFWGYLKPYAHNTAPAPDSVTVRFDPEGLDQRVPVRIGADGTYSGIIRLDRAVSGDYSIQAECELSSAEISARSAYYGETSPETTRVLEYEWIEVNEFRKPAYVIETEVEKPIYRWGDEVKVTVRPTFFDGTPAPHMPLECSVFSPSTGNLEAVVNLETDETGTAVYTFRAGDGLHFNSSLSWTPKRAYFYVKIVSEGENVTAQGHYNYVPGNIAVRPALEIDENDKVRLTVQANAVSLDAIRTEDDLAGLVSGYYDADAPDSRYDILLGEPVDANLTAKVEVDFCRPYDGTYDEKYFDYAEQVRTFELEAKDGRAVLENLAGMDRRPDTYLYVYTEVSYQAEGCTVSEYDSASNGYARYESTEDAQLKGYSFNVYLNGESTPAQQRNTYMYRDSLEAGAGDAMRFALCLDGKELPRPGGRLLYTILQDGIVEHGITQGELRLTETPAYANSILVAAAYFDGRDVYPVASCGVEFRKESAGLSIETTADREAYMPGDEITLSAKVTDQAGNPVAASILFSVVDEAVFALREQYFQLLSELYGQMDFYNFFVNKYTTRTGDIDPYNAGGDGGKGDGENLLAYDVFRKNFKDTALFLPAQSGADGTASATFRLPDNLTSWRVTALAVDGAPMGGQSRSQIITSLPFFVKPVVSDKYLAGDEAAILIKGHGSALDEDSEIDYTVTVRGNGIDSTQTFRQKACEAVTVSFGKLAEGDYVVTASGRLGDRSDTVEVPFTVIHSNLELTVHQAFDPAGPVSFPASRYPVTVTLYNQEFQRYYDSLNALLPYSCNVFSQRMARFTARRAMLRTCDEEALPARLKTFDDLSVYQRDSGGIGRCMNDSGWPWDGADPILTAWAVLTAPDQFSREQARRYLLQTAEDSAYKPEQQAAALAGAAALDPSAAAVIRQRMSRGGVSLTERLWYGIGLAWAGSTDEALALYEDTAAPMLDTRGGVVRMTGVGRQAEDDAASALAWAIAVRLNLPDADGYAGYFTERGWLGGALFPCMLYVENYPLAPAPITFGYTAGGGTGEIDLSVSGSQTLVLDSTELEGLAFHDVPEGVAGIAYYVGEPEEAGMTLSDHFTVTKETTPLEGGKYQNVVTVRMDSDAPYGYYGVSDWIPSSCRLHSVLEDGYMQEGQKLYFEFYHSERDTSKSFTYFTQRTYETEAVQDRVYAVCAENGEMSFTERGAFQ